MRAIEMHFMRSG